jgi:hypothetical protein
MDYLKLVAAGTVNTLAQGLRDKARATYLMELNLPNDSRMYTQKAAEWDALNPFTNYIKRAYRELLMTLELMDEEDVEYRKAATDEMADALRKGLAEGH